MNNTEPGKINLRQKLALFDETWSPKIVGALNGQHIKLAKLAGEFVWHQHANEDEFFLVVQGSLTIRLRDRDIHLEEGECFIVPRGVEHCPVAVPEAHVLMFEPEATVNTGEDVNDRTVRDLESI